ncbi:hypothetical protein COW64_03430 [bacterium (Candidatus Blackallbacteria) CG18_big_fil_WC_8_21_14_2_50_49_26]|nr:MAG: hypothetical protein COW64_03430 [bacterium (Candidatus Blackallbacteria) CG18_big_fil_WC_8_21_14_2_50_49_26]
MQKFLKSAVASQGIFYHQGIGHCPGLGSALVQFNNQAIEFALGLHKAGLAFWLMQMFQQGWQMAFE